MRITTIIVGALASALGIEAYGNNAPQNQNRSPEVSRRNAMATAGAAMVVGLSGSPRLASAEEDVLTPLYFGVGVSSHLDGNLSINKTVLTPEFYYCV